MNLIEKLGGYEKASEDFKKLHLNLKEQQKSNKVFMDAFDALKTELLEYRRQHNIFEVGDWVFPMVRINDEIEGVGCFICAEKGELVVVREVKTKGVYCSHEHRLDNSFYMKFSEFRHATDAEIKAGKRLEVS